LHNPETDMRTSLFISISEENVHCLYKCKKKPYSSLKHGV